MSAFRDAIIFMDVDGVLNGHEFMAEALSCGIDPECVRRLNRVLKETNARIVLSSAWRYMIHGHAMTLDGFAYLLRTHGLWGEARIIDVTCRDEDIPERCDQVKAWLAARSDERLYVVVDDLDLGFTDAGLNFVQTDGAVGLTDADADRMIAFLTWPEEDESGVAVAASEPGGG